MDRGQIAALTSCLIVTSASAARAEGKNTHDGFFLRLSLGPSFSSVESDSSPKAKISGMGTYFGVAIGGMIAENFGIFGDVSSIRVNGPELTYGNETVEADDSFSVSLSGLGVGVVYYFIPVNVYVSGAIVTDRVIAKDNDQKVAESDSGVGVNLAVGKEWWVSDNWGLGVAGTARVSQMDDKDSSESLNANAFGLVFSATYN
jgi:hypothetical protein